ncbi:Hypothetical predicted protein, partial [Paramuricea clavata]
VSLPEDRKSTTSSVRTSSSIQEKKLQARAKVAALRSKIVEEEIIEQKNLLAKHEAHLAKLKMKQQLAEAEAEVEVYEEAENEQDQIPALPKNKFPSPTTNNNNLNNKITHDNVTPAPLPVSQNVSAPDKSMNYNAPPFTPPPNSIRSAPVQQQILVPSNEQIPHTPTSVPENRQLYDSNKVILEALSLQRLPKLTPKVFEGDEMEFLRWESSFDALVASNTNDSKTMLHYLCKFLKGEPLKMVEHYQDLHHDADTAYRRAREEL